MEPRQRPMLALALRLAGAAGLAAMLALSKLAGARGVALSETMFWRQLVPTLLIGGTLAARGQFRRLATRRIGSHARRAAIGLTCMALTLLSARLLPLAEATVLSFTTPVFATILAAAMLREKVGPIRGGAVIAGFVGVLVIAGPDRGNLPLAGLGVALTASVLQALISIQLRDLGRTDEALTIVFWFSAFSTLVLLPAMPFVARAHDPATWAVLGGLGVLGLVGQVGITAALRLGRVSSVIVMDYSGIGWATLWGWLIFAQLPPASTWIGAPIVAAAGLTIVLREQRLAREGKRSAADAAPPSDLAVPLGGGCVSDVA